MPDLIHESNVSSIIDGFYIMDKIEQTIIKKLWQWPLIYYISKYALAIYTRQSVVLFIEE